MSLALGEIARNLAVRERRQEQEHVPANHVPEVTLSPEIAMMEIVQQVSTTFFLVVMVIK